MIYKGDNIMEHSFKNRIKTPVGFIKRVIWTIIFSAILLLLSTYFARRADVNEFIIIAINVAIVALILFITYYVVMHSEDYIVDEKQIIIRKKKKDKYQFLFKDSTFSSYVISHYMNGIPTGKTRQLIVYHEDKEVKYDIKLSKKNFSKFMAVIRNYSAKSQSLLDGKDEIVSNIEATYTINKDHVLREVLMTYAPLLIVAAIILLTILVTLLNVSSNSFSAFVVFGLIIIAALGFMLLASGIKVKTPSKIILQPNGILIDEDYITYQSISSIFVTPPKYTSTFGFRRISIALKEGDNLEYKFGSMRSKQLLFKEYEELINHLQTIFLDHVGVFQLDLK